jgi:hypothetical protein
MCFTFCTETVGDFRKILGRVPANIDFTVKYAQRIGLYFPLAVFAEMPFFFFRSSPQFFQI